jgi:hypothetical protein
MDMGGGTVARLQSKRSSLVALIHTMQCLPKQARMLCDTLRANHPTQAGGAAAQGLVKVQLLVVCSTIDRSGVGS